MKIHSDASSRDPVALAIETLLLEMQAKGIGAIYKTSTRNGITLAFGDICAEGKTLDIALVRLANTMIDDQKYTSFLIETLKPIRSAVA